MYMLYGSEMPYLYFWAIEDNHHFNEYYQEYRLVSGEFDEIVVETGLVNRIKNKNNIFNRVINDTIQFTDKLIELLTKTE